MTEKEKQLLTQDAGKDADGRKAFVNAVAEIVKTDSRYWGPPRNRYKVRPNSWFDEGTIANLIDDYSNGTEGRICGNCGKLGTACGWGLFEGYRNGKLDQEVCNMCEFEEPMV